MATTANGYIAKENDETPWSDVIWSGYYDFVKKRGNIILGKRTYELMKEVNEFEKLGFPITVVVSSTAENKSDENTIFVSSPKEALAVMKEKRVSEIVVGGGKGIKLFADNDADAKLKLIEVSKLSENTIRLHYEVEKRI